ncbi:keratin, type I cytoskeletal 9-like [Varroa destructor]|uniref:INO80 complex subunit E N-terminal domain-containing protein n=1 Tax=Varroa destructor TaxID=109461 RepID=A0A7M7KSY3_VARDE|nr:keratin, type I cytoskeletal 9-like [Varroa destructor]
MDPSLDPKQQYGELKRKVRQLIAENEIYKQEIAKVNDRLLRVTRDKAFLLDQLLPYEEDDSSTESELSDSDQDSHLPTPQPQPNTPSVPRRTQLPHIGTTGQEKNNRSGTSVASEKPPSGTKKPRPPRPRKPRNPQGGGPGGEPGGPCSRFGGGGGPGKSGNGKGGNSSGHNLDASTGNGGAGGGGSKRLTSSSNAQENHYLEGSGGGSSGGYQKGSGSHKDASGAVTHGAPGDRSFHSVSPGSGGRKSGGGGGQRKKARLEQQAAVIAGQGAQPVQAGRQQHAKSASRHRSSNSSNTNQTYLHQGTGGYTQSNTSARHASSGRKSGSHAVTVAAAAALASNAGSPIGVGLTISRESGTGTAVSTNSSLEANHSRSGHHGNSSGVIPSPSVAAATRPNNPLTPEELERHLAAKQGARKIQSLPPQPASLTLPAELFNEDAFLGDFAAEQIV